MAVKSFLISGVEGCEVAVVDVDGDDGEAGLRVVLDRLVRRAY